MSEAATEDMVAYELWESVFNGLPFIGKIPEWPFMTEGERDRWRCAARILSDYCDESYEEGFNDGVSATEEAASMGLERADD